MARAPAADNSHVSLAHLAEVATGGRKEEEEEDEGEDERALNRLIDKEGGRRSREGTFIRPPKCRPRPPSSFLRFLDHIRHDPPQKRSRAAFGGGRARMNLQSIHRHTDAGSGLFMGQLVDS